MEAFPEDGFQCVLLRREECDVGWECAQETLVLHRTSSHKVPLSTLEFVALVHEDKMGLKIVGLAAGVSSLMYYNGNNVDVSLVPESVRGSCANVDAYLGALGASRKSRLFLICLSGYKPVHELRVQGPWSLSKSGWGQGRVPPLVRSTPPRKRHRSKGPVSRVAPAPDLPAAWVKVGKAVNS